MQFCIKFIIYYKLFYCGLFAVNKWILNSHCLKISHANAQETSLMSAFKNIFKSLLSIVLL